PRGVTDGRKRSREPVAGRAIGTDRGHEGRVREGGGSGTPCMPWHRPCSSRSHSGSHVTTVRIAPAHQRVRSARSVDRIAIGSLLVRPLVLVLHVVLRVVQATPDVVTGVAQVL